MHKKTQMVIRVSHSVDYEYTCNKTSKISSLITQFPFIYNVALIVDITLMGYKVSDLEYRTFNETARWVYICGL